ncbi:zinc metalloprotease HtpX [Candidatus Giovannonibacteria bacterium RIFCSPLOWO2_02_FULL_43_11b]|uniref:Protease HtpX homolog n=1 Tax=Candidatus Giovannonibacteria bacterium RIFCSPHIGHO2_12_FULL_43_15 TaxID=1798341 RepID=A0A1F5WP04_9BACT|nr:MAG: zinc metalloprotease HtpX [Candidatus Giovannonibacteria bacterium RIFCSPHIGHO2_01_FULL_43_100]OGF67342.1 MAG: zinc metalloprotease HtpX [Candidatus Giovannonibacteria bacterium RIFCSPHIGHO2_02_FULL_43_32]OGF77334.1 MAG: zinc metalloprotease HtpX [Candidatus Giovannonibacteria bacterium RIFCSPHIGHO2_12_FULL_43_15]OGF78945.1 MAG: zinc metalloprotease HtpX [Candidatus Giovannonibacteria bacterium RIFCSPLOWO2_01_FULL_43_60]OGF89097.1 MAG: zinc metalloprotease HtpX [Candidatus Giovannonibac
MATIWTHRDSNIRKTWLLITGFLIFVTTIGWVFSQVYGNPVIFLFAFVLSVLMSVFSYWFSDKIVIRTTGAKPLAKENAPEVHNIVENLAITAGIPKPRIYIVDAPQPNAFATGRDPEHAIVAVTSGILQIMNKTELEGVLAHEMSHIGNRDMLVSTVVVVLVGVIQLLSDIFLRSMRFGFRGNNDRNGGQAGLILLLIGIILAILAPIAAILIQLAVSRKREYLADASGVLLTRYPEGLASALQKLAQDNTPMRQASHATAHLWLDDPYQGKQKTIGWFSKLFMTHPPIEDRIKKLREM